MSDTKSILKMGAQLSAFVGGNTASLHVKGSGGACWTVTSQTCEHNHEALKRVLTAALCWLDATPQYIEPALRGEVVLRPGPKERTLL